jgi:hypothetical protein
MQRLWGRFRVFDEWELKRGTLKLQAVWKFEIRENAFHLPFPKKWGKIARSHMLRKRRTMCHTALLRRRQLQKRLNSFNKLAPSFSGPDRIVMINRRERQDEGSH